jgi:hypothetical protein
MPAGRPRKYKTPKQMLEVAHKYFDDCLANKEPITVTGTCMALGFLTRESLINYDGRPEFSDAVKSIKLVCQNYAEYQMYKSNNAAGPIFALKNFGWSDKQDHTLSGPEGGPIQTDSKIEIILCKPNSPKS